MKVYLMQLQHVGFLGKGIVGKEVRGHCRVGSQFRESVQYDTNFKYNKSKEQNFA